MSERSFRFRGAEILLGNLVVLATLAYAWALNSFGADLYYRSVQEDETIEWATFWAFVIAAGAFATAAIRQRRGSGRRPWFLLGVALFCFVVAGEEISWAQRWLAYRPPAYFLEHNFQQELNVHNVVSAPLRKLVLQAVILGYGVVLPLAALAPPIRRLLSVLSVVPPPAGIAPAFLATYLTYEIYPWDFSGEWVELMLGGGMLVAGVAAAHRFCVEHAPPVDRRGWLGIVLAWLLVIGLGIATPTVSRIQRSAQPEHVQAAEVEVEALREDFLGMTRRNRSGPVTKCNLHKRVYTWIEKYNREEFFEGAFSGLVAQGLPAERMVFFIDPWNLPYWVRDRCSGDNERRIVFVYSFGPNRRRDSSRREILGDDIGAVIYQVGEPPD